MPLFTWVPQFSVGIKGIDEEHKKLLGYINTLYDAMKEGKGKDVLGKVLTELSDYTVFHFNHEQQLFKQYGYPATAAHLKEHDAFTAKIKGTKEKFDSGASVVTVELMNYLKDWLKTHILDIDKKYSSFFNSKGVS